ncbi:MAG: hypothetical protein RIS29_2010 [Bacteroidota bacterium]
MKKMCVIKAKMDSILRLDRMFVWKQHKFRAIMVAICGIIMAGVPVLKAQSSFSGANGDLWYDSNGATIQAHGGQVLKVGDKWWWIGENRNGNNNICLYSSSDLYSWKNEGYALQTAVNRADLDTMAYFVQLYGHLSSAGKDSVFDGIARNKVVERPKLMYNAKTGKYIIWFHDDDSNYGAAAAGVAIADSIRGPYRFVKRSRLHQMTDAEYGTAWYEATNYRGFARDMNVFVDDDGQGYIIYSSEENRTMFISRLNKEYTDLDVPKVPVGLAKNGVDFVRLFPGGQREAPAMFKYNGKYYMVNSGATGWSPNAAQYWVADKIMGPWTNWGDPCVSEAGIPYPASTTYASQSTCIIPIDAKLGKFIYMGDRWNSSKLSDSRYIWLPVVFTQNGSIQIRSKSNWRLNYLDSINTIRYDVNKLNKVVFADTDLPTNIDAQIRGTNDWVPTNLKMTWQTPVSSLVPGAIAAVKGTCTINGVETQLSAKAANVPENMIYYVDCGATAGSSLLDSINKRNMAPALINKQTPDRAFDATTGWGYLGAIGTDIGYKDNTSTDPMQSGWWAYGSKYIDYKFKITNGTYRIGLGFHEWWGYTRALRGMAYYYNVYGSNKQLLLGNLTNSAETVLSSDISVADISATNPYLTIRVMKTGTNDGILSWLSISSLSSATDVKTLSATDFTLYPNPVSSNADLHFTTSDHVANNEMLSIYNLSGALVMQALVQTGVTSIKMDIAAGSYIVHWHNKNTKLVVAD